jgi:hypothetical protein
MPAELVLTIFLLFLLFTMLMQITSNMITFQYLRIRAQRCKDRRDGNSLTYCYEKCAYSSDCPYWRKITFKERIKLYFKK